MSASGAARRWHVWLGWIAGLPLLFWTVSGLWMVARPIEEVRGEHLKAPAPTLALPRALRPPDVGAATLKSLAVEARGDDDPIWVAAFADGSMRAADLDTGAWLPPVARETAVRVARAHYLGRAAVEGVDATRADDPPVDLRRPRPTWRVRFSDGARIYVDRDTGGVLALRTRQWRVFDWMWGLHILDLRGREDTSHPLLIAAAAVSFAAILLGLVLVPLASRRRRKRS